MLDFRSKNSYLYESSQNNFFVKISVNINLKYVAVSIAAKCRCNLREYHRNISKFVGITEILHFLTFLVSCPAKLPRFLAFAQVQLRMLRRIQNSIIFSFCSFTNFLPKGQSQNFFKLFNFKVSNRVQIPTFK